MTLGLDSMTGLDSVADLDSMTSLDSVADLVRLGLERFHCIQKYNSY